MQTKENGSGHCSPPPRTVPLPHGAGPQRTLTEKRARPAAQELLACSGPVSPPGCRLRLLCGFRAAGRAGQEEPAKPVPRASDETSHHVTCSKTQSSGPRAYVRGKANFDPGNKGTGFQPGSARSQSARTSGTGSGREPGSVASDAQESGQVDARGRACGTG